MRVPDRPVTVVALLGSPGRVRPAASRPRPPPPGARGHRVVGYFTDWGIYGRDYQVKDVETSGAAAGSPIWCTRSARSTGGRCAAGDGWADYREADPAGDSVDGGPTTDDGLRGNIGQLRRLKARHPQLKVIWSFGGWTGSDGFTDAAADPAAFADVLPRAGERSALGRRLRRHRHGLGVSERLRPGLRLQRPGRAGRLLARCARRSGRPRWSPRRCRGGRVGKLDATDYAGAARSATGSAR